MNSRGAATECSPGREPGVFFRHDLSPGGAKESFAPSGLRSRTTPTPGLRPGLHSVAAPRLNTAQVLARARSGSFLDRNHNLDRSAVVRRECAFHHCNTTFRCSCLRGGHQRGYVRSVHCGLDVMACGPRMSSPARWTAACDDGSPAHTRKRA